MNDNELKKRDFGIKALHFSSSQYVDNPNDAMYIIPNGVQYLLSQYQKELLPKKEGTIGR
jgi:hypothetical protein